ncbi:MAG: FAD-binding oxidoreductase [Gammaproteobacteria bacterium]|nr:FAD-binding oxidoreductase [Gammaproteobacteria bacterium]
MVARQRQRSFWTWGFREDEPNEDVRQRAAKSASNRLGREVKPPVIPSIESIQLRDSRISIPSRLRSFVRDDQFDRVVHTHGGHVLELLQAIRGEFPYPPDAVAHPSSDQELEELLEWCNRDRIKVVPYGGGTSVVWGVNPPADAERIVTVDTDRLNQILEVDEVSRAAKFQAGILGPDLEAELKPLDLTLRHYPQSFPWSTVGGWIATRSGGHYATNHTHIDDFVESTRMITPSGWFESRRLPGSGAGPSPDRLVLGSEGTLGIITEAWLRLQVRPKYRASASVFFDDWYQGTRAVRTLVQTKLFPANLRILDPAEATLAAGVQTNQALLIIGFESADVPQNHQMNTMVEMVRDLGGQVNDEDVVISDGSGKATGRKGSVGQWRNSFIGVNAGAQLGLGLLSDTFETATTWDNWEHFDRQVRTKVGDTLKRVLGNSSSISCRFTHVYPDGPAPYYTFSGIVPIGHEVEAWQEIKNTANEVIIDNGGTITHHHAVGRLHKSAWEAQRPELFGSMLKGAKASVDPQGLMNPGVLIGD